MSAPMKTILVIGGTSGIGEAFARRFHSMGKKVIITGRRENKLSEIQKSLPGLETYVMDNRKIEALEGHVRTLFSRFPDIDTVWINSGIQYASDVKDVSSTTDERVVDEITTNFTAPIVIGRHVIPRLLAQKGKETHFIITSSGLAYVANGKLFPVYAPTKSGIHQYMVSVRQAVQDTNLNVMELVGPYVATDLVVEHQDVLKNFTPMPLQEFTDTIFDQLESKPAKELTEMVAGTATAGVQAWRAGIGELLAARGLGG